MKFPKFSTKNTNNLHLSSSLQDLSSYHLDPQQPINLDGTHLLQNQKASIFPKSKPPLPLRKKWVRLIAFVLSLILFILSFYMIVTVIYSNWIYNQGLGRYYVVLDCGSTGTRVYVYQAQIYNKDDSVSSSSSLPIAIKSLRDGSKKNRGGRAYDRMETEPGLDKLVHNVSGLKAALKPLLKWAQKQIPEDAHRSTLVFLYATAGVRRLPSQDSRWLLDSAWNVIKGSSPFVCRKDSVKIITGTEEAYFGWIALNYHSRILGTKPRKETYGALDLGGSSLQVTFEGDREVNGETSLNVRIGSVNHHLTAYSLAGYGLNEAFDKSVAHLFKKEFGSTSAVVANEIKELKHPCLQTGYKDQFTCSRCSANNQEGESPRVKGEMLDKKGQSRTPVMLIGAPNWQECSALAKVAVNLSEWSDVKPGLDCEVHPCALRDNLPRPLGHFYVISGFFVVYRFFNLSSEATLDDILEKGKDFCEKRWDIAKKSVAPQPFIEQYCFRAPYISSLLREGLHITDKHITVGSGSITWTLGVALLEAGKAYSPRFGLHGFDLLQTKINPFILIPILVISFILLLCALSCVANCMPRFFWRQYLPLFRHNSASSASVINIPSPFRFRRWSPIISAKTPLSPTIASSQERPFSTEHGLSVNNGGGGIQLMESSFYPSASSVSHSYSSSNLSQMQFDSSNIGTFWTPHRSQMRLQSRRSQSRDDLISSVPDAHIVNL
ncbi:PREDICTED: probable apyrase 7 isoform X2 [Lupinus angustifolius]|uniref:probable apyrase 7 isoform X2 n=1 Tax=Lupinus angustifolius TaxID=3871 RepID=UPI00092EEF71|nr:PREDICTED: probable apyrase 7 isoform X2 [Lupinus angustifolius]